MKDNIIYVYVNGLGRAKSLMVDWNKKTKDNEYYCIIRDLATSEICSHGHASEKKITEIVNHLDIRAIF